MAKTRKVSEEVAINDIREKIRAELIKKYGNIATFLKSPDCEKFGGRKIRCYLYDKGAINYEVIAHLAKYLGIGTLKRKIVVTRSFTYHLVKNAEEDKNLVEE